MHCREFEERLNDLLDERERPADDRQLAAHAAQCGPCRQALAGHDALLSGLARAATPPLGRDFARRVIAATSAGPAPGRVHSAQRGWLAIGAALASAAAMLIGLSLAWRARDSDPAAIAGPTTASRGRPSLTGADLLIQAPRFPNHVRTSFDELAIALPGAVDRLDEVEQIAPGIRPLRVSLFLIWDTLCRTVPGVRDSEPQPRERTTHWALELMRVA
jgi:hypothetical protein